MGNVAEAVKKNSTDRTKARRRAGQSPKSKTAPPAAPQRKALKVLAPNEVNYSPALVVWHDPDSRLGEQYRSLRSHLLAHYHDKPFGMIVTSAKSGEGKTITCLNLAFALAACREYRTVVVDCDFRKHGVARTLHDKSPRGLVDVLTGRATPDEVILPTTYPNVSVVVSGKASRKGAGLSARAELEDMVRYLRKQYDFVLFDTPPVNALSDAGVIGRVAGDALLVVRMNSTRRESAQSAIDRLKALNVKIAGTVLTRHKYFIPEYLYRYS